MFFYRAACILSNFVRCNEIKMEIFSEHPEVLRALVDVLMDECNTPTAQQFAVIALLRFSDEDNVEKVMLKAGVVASLAPILSPANVSRTPAAHDAAVETLYNLCAVSQDCIDEAKRCGITGSMINWVGIW